MNKKICVKCMMKCKQKDMAIKKGVEDERKKRIEQLEHILDRIEDLIKAYPETIVLIPLMELFNDIGLMQMED